MNCLEISYDKKLLLAAGNPVIHLYDMNSNDEKPLRIYEGHTGNVTGIGFEKDLKWIFSCSEDGSIRIWDIRSDRQLRVYNCGCAVNTAFLSPHETVIISGDQNGFVKVWDLEIDGCSETHLPLPEMPIRSISIVSLL